MSGVGITLRRTVGMARNMYSTAVAVAGFLAGAAVLFAFNLEAAEGGFSPLSSVWAASVSPAMPVLCALLGMDAWSEERRTGRIDMLLSSPVKERDFTIGKFLGVWIMSLVAAAVSLAAALAFLGWHAGGFLSGVSLWGFPAAFAGIALQSALWSALAVASSSLFTSSAAAAALSCALSAALPRGLWFALSSWSPSGRSSFGEMPFDAHAFDMGGGLFAAGPVAFYASFTFFALFLASKKIASLRCAGRGGAALRRSSRAAVALALAFSVLASTLAFRLDAAIDLPVSGGGAVRFSQRTRNILTAADGTVRVTAFLSRRDPLFRRLAHFLRAFRRQASETGGVRIEVRYVDPVLDIGESQRFARAGLEPGSVVFERSGRIAGSVPAAGCGEKSCAAAIERIASPFRRSSIYWTSGHGEAAFDDYGPHGLSDLARALSLDGYAHKRLDLAAGGTIGDDCALIAIAGPRTDFSSAEAARIKSYLDGGPRGGGRLLAMLDASTGGALEGALSSWGVRFTGAPAGPVRTLSGTDAVATDFEPSHPVSRAFAGEQIVLENPVCVEPSAAADEGQGSSADRKSFVPLVRAGGSAVAAAVERGAGGGDLAMRPTRIVAVGDVGFAMNARLKSFANANADFVDNAVRFLSGRDTASEAGSESSRLSTGMDRETRSRFAFASCVYFPSAAFLVFAAGVARRRRRQ